MECLALKVRTENEDAFNLAYDRNAMFQAERFTIRRGRSAKKIANKMRLRSAFQTQLAGEFQDHKKSDRVLVRSYQEDNCTNIVVYHERRVQSTLIFRGTRTRPKVRATVFRPLQQDFVRYNQATGVLEIEARYESEEEKLRQSFAKCFLGDKNFFEGGDADKCLNLGRIADPTFSLRVPDGSTAKLVQLRFKLPQKGGPSFDIRSKDVLKTLEINKLRRKLKADLIEAATIKVRFTDDKRGKRVGLSGQNKLNFNRCTHADEVLQILRDSELLLSDDDEEGDETPSQSAGTSFGAAAHDGRAATTISRRRTVPKDKTTAKIRRERPR